MTSLLPAPRLVVSVILSTGLLIGVAACGANDAGTVAAESIPTSTETVTGPAPEESPLPPPEEDEVEISVTASPTASSSPRTQKAAPSRSFPEAFDPEQGEAAWAAVVSVGEDATEPALQQAQAALREVGYENAGQTGAGCMQGAQDLLKLPPDAYDAQAVALFFRTQAQAKQFEAAFDGDILGIAKVNVYCGD